MNLSVRKPEVLFHVCAYVNSHYSMVMVGCDQPSANSSVFAHTHDESDTVVVNEHRSRYQS